MQSLKFFALGIIVAIAMIGFGVAIGQSSAPVLGNAQVQIEQAIPIVVDLLVPTDDGDSITTTVPLTMNVSLLVSLSGATVTKIEAATTPIPEPTIVVRDSQSVPGMAGVDDLGIPYILKVPDGLKLDTWEVKEKEDGGIDYEFKVSTPGKKFDSDLKVNVSYLDNDDVEIAKAGAYYLGSMSSQDRETRSYKSSLDCSWSECAGIQERAKSYILTFDVELVDFP